MKRLRGFTRALNESGRFGFKPPEQVVDYLVIGGGVVGLAIAQRLSQRFPSKSTYLVERHGRAGEETSSRNSEVIHSGLYYPPDSLKTRLCLRGRDMMYERCKAYNIPHKRVGKLVVAQKSQQDYICNLHAKSLKLQWPPHSPKSSQTSRGTLVEYGDGKLVLPTELLSGDQAREMEPDLSKDITAALWCPTTGIVDSHSLMESLERDITDSENGEFVYSTRVVRVDISNRSQASRAPDLNGVEDGWVVQVVTGGAEEGDALLARTLINASGLSSTLILNAILPHDSRIPMYYARGSYASYHGPGVGDISHLIYPCPKTGPNVHAFQSLGSHLTFDLRGRIRFGPDLEWIEPPPSSLLSQDLLEDKADFWNEYLIPDETRIPEMYREVTDYLPGVRLAGLQPDYCGMRPKLVPPWGGFQDFLFRLDRPGNGGDARRPMLSLLGIESPGLTSSLAIAEHVVEDILHSQLGHE